MKIRLGYVALCRTVELPYRNITYTEYIKKDNYSKLDEIIKYNLNNLYETLLYNQKNDIHFFRITSNLVPLATKDDVEFNYITPYQKEYKKIGAFIRENNMRCDMHPDQFAVLNSTNQDVISNALGIVFYHASLLKELQIENPLIILHVGSSVLGKKNSITRFIHSFQKLPKEVGKMIALENDDKTFTIEDVVGLCETLQIRMVLDYHHYICNPGELDIHDFYPRIFATWGTQTPKIHYSSPKNKTKKDIRSHSDYVNADEFIAFIESVRYLQQDIDIMLEVKEKDMALCKLVRELIYKTDYHFIDGTTFEI